jgi:hypothetical protein
MNSFKLSTPVAFIIFNRPDTTERVFAEIAKAQPTKLLIIADGARANKLGESEKVAATRAIIQRVNWSCEVLTNYSEVNLGCKRRVSSGIDWVFEQVEEAIILEDDCLPAPTFFRFCEEMLERHRHDQRIGMISGDNFHFGQRRNKDSYYFSKYVHIWGWATWRDRWQKSYDVELKKWPVVQNGGWMFDMIGNSEEAASWGATFEKIYEGKIDTWDYQWVFANWFEGRINVMPTVNLISNIGFGVEATHTTETGIFSNMLVEDISFPMIHPVGVFRHLQEDKLSQININKKSLALKLRNKVAGWIRSLCKV